MSVFTLQNNKRFGRPGVYTDEEKITVSALPDLIIDLNLVFAALQIEL